MDHSNYGRSGGQLIELAEETLDACAHQVALAFESFEFRLDA
jgi:hypothetical protein